MTPIECVLDKLERVRRTGSGYTARCSAHDDRENSLSVGKGTDGRVLLNCFAGCPVDRIVSAIGMTMADLFPDPERRNGRGGGGGTRSSRSGDEQSNGAARGLTVAAYARAKRLPEEFLRTLGLTDISYSGAPAVRIPYLGPDGGEQAIRFRLQLEKGDGADVRFKWRKGSRVAPYGLWKLEAACQAGHVTVVEGESDTQTLWHHDEPAIGFPGADTVSDDWLGLLAEIPRIYAVIEPDRGGETVLERLRTSRIRDQVHLVHLGQLKDPSGLHLDDPERFTERWQQALASAEPLVSRISREEDAAASEAFALAEELLTAPDLLQQIGQAMQRRGYAGDRRPPTLGYVAMTSRLLERPQNLAFVAQSSTGKNRALDAGLELLPSEEVYIEKAGSARALVYCDEDFSHRVVVVSEADSIPEDGPAASAIRSLAADNELAYDVVEKNPKSGRFETRHIVKPGPTGLVTTSTRSLGTQMGTRMLEVPLPDDAEQTRKVMKAHARTVMPTIGEPFDLGPLLAVQRWLKLAGNRRVAVPFAEVLAELLPSDAVRMRRDFRQLLTCIQAIALLHQCQRQVTPEGWINATIEDYGHARDLLAPIFDTIAADGATPAIRQTVEAVEVGEEVSASLLATRLKLAKATVSWRVNRAMRSGWLVNSETRKGHPAKLSRGAPLPDQTATLPSPVQVREAFECSNDDQNERDTPSRPSTDGREREQFEL